MSFFNKRKKWINCTKKPSLSLSLEDKSILYVETSSLVVLNLIVSNFLFKPFKITPGHKKTANQQLMAQVEQSMVSYSRHLNRLQGTGQ